METGLNTRHDWQKSEILELFALPFGDLLHQAHATHIANFKANSVQLAALLNIKTGRCPEDCKYCTQSIHYKTALTDEKLTDIDTVITAAKAAKANGATRFCLGAAWRSPTNRQLAEVSTMIKAIKDLGLEACCTLGMLKPEQAETLKNAGLDYYNHNIDTSPEYYSNVITTRTFADRLDTLENVRNAGIKVCCGGILGMGESREDRASFLQSLANLPKHPESVPINQLIAVSGTPLENQKLLDPLEFIRTIAVARILMPKSVLRLSAGRDQMDELMQAICFYAGANSCFYGGKLLTQKNPETNADISLFAKLGIEMQHEVALEHSECC